MQEQRIGIIMNGVTGRMWLNQHLVRSILAIRRQGGIFLADGTTLMPDPILVGRNEAKLKAIADVHGLTKWTTDLDRALDSTEYSVYFDSNITGVRYAEPVQLSRLLASRPRQYGVRQCLQGAVGLFLRHVACDTPFPHTFVDGARGVQLAEFGLKSWTERRWLDLPLIDDQLYIQR